MTNAGVLGPKGRALGEPQGTPSFGSMPTFEPATNTLQYRKGPKWIPGLALYNCNADSFARWRSAVSGARAGSRGAAHLVAGPGDSTTFGSNATGNVVANSWAGRLTSMLSQAGRYGPVREGITWCGMEGTPTRFTLGTGWSSFNGGQGPGQSGVFQATAGAAGSLDFAPSGNVDTFIVYYTQFAGGATISCVVDSGSATTKSTAGANATGTFTVSAGASGTHVLKISSTVSGTAYIMGVEAYDSTATQGIKVTRAGNSGSTSGAWPGGGGWSGRDPVIASAPDLATLCLGVNDALGAVSVQNYKANMRAIAAALAAANSSVLLISQWQPGTTWTNYAQWPQFVQAQYELADELNVPLLDLTARYNTAPGANPYSLYADNVHPNNAGHVDWAAAVAQVIQHVS